MPVGKVPAGWRQERLLHELTLPDSGWFVDVEAAESISAITRLWPDVLAGAGVSVLTTANLRGERRVLTTALALRIHGVVLHDGALPHGIVYGSKHDSQWRCWAIWLRKVADGMPVSSEPTVADSGQPIDPPRRNVSLRRVCGLFDIHCH